MKIHIAQRNDTFQSIAEKYNVSVQDLIGMNTHINHSAGLVPGLKVKIPTPVRKEESNVAQHIEKYYPNLDTNPMALKTATTADVAPALVNVAPVAPQPVQQAPQEEVLVKNEETTSSVEEVIPVPLKSVENEVATKPNDGVKVAVGGSVTKVEEQQVTVTKKTEKKEKEKTQTPKVADKAPITPYPAPLPTPMYPTYSGGCSASAVPLYAQAPVPYGPSPYLVSPYAPNPYYGMRSAVDDRFFIGGFGYPVYGGFGWGGYPYYGWGWGGYPYYGGWYQRPY